MRCRIMLVLGAVLVMFTIGLLPGVQASYQDPFITTDEFGDAKFNFALEEDVYITGGDFEGFDEVTIYIIPTGEDVIPENAVTEPVNASPIQYLSMNPLPTTLIWSAPLEAGEYDVWIDVNQNGQFERYFDEYRIVCCCHFFMVIPEFAVGAAGGLIAMLAAFMFFRRSESSRKSISRLKN